MVRLYLVEPVVALYAFAGFLVSPLVSQYVYRRLWQEITNTSYPDTQNASTCGSDNSSTQEKEVQKAASLFSLYNELFSMIPSLAVTLLLVAYSDQRGRRLTMLLPVLGSFIYTSSILAVSFFQLDLRLIIVANFISALFGGWGTLLGGCFSYVADRCEDGRRKTLRMAGVDMSIGLFSGVAGISTGYFLRAAGFNWPFLTACLTHVASLLYVALVLEETLSPPVEPSRQHPCWRIVLGVYDLFAQASWRRNVVMLLLLFTFSMYSFINTGNFSTITLYELSEPLCWNEILIGYAAALFTVSFITSFLGVFLLSRCLPDIVIALIGLLSVMSGMITISFAKTTLLMFIARAPMLMAIAPAPVLRSMMSKVVSKSEQGALFACVAFLESLSSNSAVAVFNSIYASTVAWFPGFCFQLAAGLCVIPMLSLGVAWLMGLGRVKEDEQLLVEDEDTPSV